MRILSNSMAWLALIFAYKWNRGNIITQSFLDNKIGKVWQMSTTMPDLTCPFKQPGHPPFLLRNNLSRI